MRLRDIASCRGGGMLFTKADCEKRLAEIRNQRSIAAFVYITAVVSGAAIVEGFFTNTFPIAACVLIFLFSLAVIADS